ncbi:MAG: four helix bundle protein [Bacteroidia bacterium]|nr:four helix bundle protein [Bacteroidia bacterium]
MIIKRFEDIIAWQKAQEFAVNIYKIFRESKDYGFRDQICRAVVSVSNNIAEGFDRNSDLDFQRFIHISKSSCNEVKSMIYLAEKLNYIKTPSKIDLINKADEILKILNDLIKKLF